MAERVIAGTAYGALGSSGSEASVLFTTGEVSGMDPVRRIVMRARARRENAREHEK